MRRRTVLTVCGSSFTALAGCLGGDEGTVTPTPSGEWDSEIPSSSPMVSCSVVSRPMATTVEREGALDPRAYPGPPPANLTDEVAQEYVTDFELAYRQNDEMRTSTDSYLTRFDISVQESWIAAGPADSIVVRLRYVGSGTVHPGTEFDYVPQYVTYYVDSSLVVRARTTRNDFDGADTLDPDPWNSGDPVACFEG